MSKIGKKSSKKIAGIGEATFVVVKDDLDGEGFSLRYPLLSTPRLSVR